MQKNGRRLTHDDYGLRALMQNVCVSAASMKSETSSIFKQEDLGFTEEVRQRIKKPNYAYASMESPFSHQFVGPMSAYTVPNEYNHRLGSKGILAQPTLPKMATDTVCSFFIYSSFRLLTSWWILLTEKWIKVNPRILLVIFNDLVNVPELTV